jgi:hypothetical protein
MGYKTYAFYLVRQYWLRSSRVSQTQRAFAHSASDVLKNIHHELVHAGNSAVLMTAL